MKYFVSLIVGLFLYTAFPSSMAISAEPIPQPPPPLPLKPSAPPIFPPPPIVQVSGPEKPDLNQATTPLFVQQPLQAPKQIQNIGAVSLYKGTTQIAAGVIQITDAKKLTSNSEAEKTKEQGLVNIAQGIQAVNMGKQVAAYLDNLGEKQNQLSSNSDSTAKKSNYPTGIKSVKYSGFSDSAKAILGEFERKTGNDKSTLLDSVNNDEHLYLFVAKTLNVGQPGELEKAATLAVVNAEISNSKADPIVTKNITASELARDMELFLQANPVRESISPLSAEGAEISLPIESLSPKSSSFNQKISGERVPSSEEISKPVVELNGLTPLEMAFEDKRSLFERIKKQYRKHLWESRF
jgi:hypothetical protein